VIFAGRQKNVRNAPVAPLSTTGPIFPFSHSIAISRSSAFPASSLSLISPVIRASFFPERPPYFPAGLIGSPSHNFFFFQSSEAFFRTPSSVLEAIMASPGITDDFFFFPKPFFLPVQYPSQVSLVSFAKELRAPPDLQVPSRPLQLSH